MSIIMRASRKALSKNPVLYRIARKYFHQLLFILQKVRYLFSARQVDLVRFGYHKGLKGYSQYGQELYLRSKKLIPEKGGFFVEIGAYHPKWNSNTYLLETEMEYTGISVDPLEDYLEEWKSLRPKTVFLNCAVSNRHGPVSFTRVKLKDGWEDQISGITDTFSLAGKPHETECITVECMPLRDVFERTSVPVDVLFIDVEGHEMNVLESNDWDRFKPKIIGCENCGSRKDRTALRRYFSSCSYRHLARIWLVDDVFILDENK